MIIGKVLAKRAFISPNREALIFNDRTFTYGLLNQRVNRLASSLMDMGIKKGDRTGLLMFNSNEFVETYFALSKIGAVLVPLNTRLATPEMDFILADCRVAGFIYGRGFEEAVLKMDVPKRVRNRISAGPSSLAGTLDYEELVRRGRDEEPAVSIDEDDLNVIMYTSGTTGNPKGAMLTHRGMYTGGVDMAIGLDYQYPDRCLILGPFFHSGAITPLIGHIVRGICSVIMDRFDPAGALGLMEKYKIRLMLGVTTIMRMMLQVPNLESYDLKSWKYAILPGSPLPYSLIKEACDRLGVLCQNLWGMTEMCGPGSLMNVEDILRKPECAGKPYFNVDIRVVDKDGRDVPRGEIGEIITRAPNVMLGYWNRPEDNKKTIVDGWLHTGDMGRFDEEGYLYVVDRAKDMFISGGENVYPAEIEKVIRNIPGVSVVSVIGVHNELWGEVPQAFIVKEANADLTPGAVVDHCRSQLAKYKVPGKIEFVDSLPTTPSGKVLKTVLRQWARSR